MKMNQIDSLKCHDSIFNEKIKIPFKVVDEFQITNLMKNNFNDLDLIEMTMNRMRLHWNYCKHQAVWHQF